MEYILVGVYNGTEECSEGKEQTLASGHSYFSNTNIYKGIDKQTKHYVKELSNKQNIILVLFFSFNIDITNPKRLLTVYK